MILVIVISVQDCGDNMSEIILPKSLIDQFNEHAEADYPYECCGFLLGDFKENQSECIYYLKTVNTKEENRERRFLIDPIVYQQAEDAADREGKSIVGIVHSHPDHPDVPSEFDRNHAWPGFSYIVIAVEKGKVKSFRSWQLTEDRSKFIEEPIITKGE